MTTSKSPHLSIPPIMDFDSRDLTSHKALALIRLALEAPDLGSGVVPTLNELIEHTAAVGAAYFQIKTAESSTPLVYQVRAAAGELPDTPGMQAIAAHGLPADTPLMRALLARRTPMFFDDTAAQSQTAGFPELGVVSLAAAPVVGKRGELVGIFLMHTFVLHAWSEAEVQLFSNVAGTIAALIVRLAAEEDANAAREAALRALGLALETRDRETQGHTDRVVKMSLQLAEHLGLDEAETQALRWGAYLHDIGKIAIADSILRKPDKLSAEEVALMQTHVDIGHTFASTLGFLPPESLAVVLQHHERWDGQGYPAKVSGEEIHLLARIFALCDVYDALISERPYKQAWTQAQALREIVAQSGQHFDPQVVSAFLKQLGQVTEGLESEELNS